MRLERGSTESRASLKTASIVVAFEDVNTEDATARAVGVYGNDNIIARLAVQSLHFLAGTLRVTTIFNRESRDGKLKALHTRHEYTDLSIPDITSRPELAVQRPLRKIRQSVARARERYDRVLTLGVEVTAMEPW